MPPSQRALPFGILPEALPLDSAKGAQPLWKPILFMLYAARPGKRRRGALCSLYGPQGALADVRPLVHALEVDVVRRPVGAGEGFGEGIGHGCYA